MSCTLQQYINQHGIHVVYLSTLSNPKIPQNLPEKSTRVANTSSLLPCYLFVLFFFATCERYLLLLFFDPPRKSFPFLRNTQHRTGRLSKMLYREFRYIPFRIQQIFGQRLNENLSAHLFLFSLLKLRAENIIFRVAKVLTIGKGLWHLFLVE